MILDTVCVDTANIVEIIHPNSAYDLCVHLIVEDNEKRFILSYHYIVYSTPSIQLLHNTPNHMMFLLVGVRFELVPICQKQLINCSYMLYPVFYRLDDLRGLSLTAPYTLMLNITDKAEIDQSSCSTMLCVCLCNVCG